MTSENLTPAKPTDQHAVFVAGLREFADWLEARPWAPVMREGGSPQRAQFQIDLFGVDGLAKARAIGEQVGVKAQEDLDDRTSVDVRVGSVAYAVIAWHPSGRDHEAELERLRAEVAELRGASASTKAPPGPDPDHACAAHDDAHLGQPCPDRTITRACPTCSEPHDHVHACAVCGEAELDDGKPFECPTHGQVANHRTGRPVHPHWARHKFGCGGGRQCRCVIPDADTGLAYSREPESTVVSPVPAGVEGHPEGRAAGIPAHYDTTADPSSLTTDCACGAVRRGATVAEAVAALKAHIAAPELKPETVALVARVEAALPSQSTPEFTRIQERLLSTQVCTSLPDDEATARMNQLPSGTSHGWQLSTEPENAPVACADQPETHRHLIFDC